jgi:uncharacterized protein (TIGR03086 family)
MAAERDLDMHRRALAGFRRVVETPDARWDAPSPCTEWDARAVVEHVIGFHEVLVLRPLEIRAHRPKGDPVARWDATERALLEALPVLTEDMQRLLPALTTDVLVHTWDLARAIGADETLDAELVERAHDQAAQHPDRFLASGMYAAPIDVSAPATRQEQMLAQFGRHP